ncbi:hypothetical protein BDZ97DRAFT_1753484 [Flammula alnicola]|nr:hypothetical protein BDZ97DRAFT_1753484 [Flammula alnicola]
MSRSTKAGRQLQLDQGWSSVLNVLELAVLNVLELAVLNVLELAHLVSSSFLYLFIFISLFTTIPRCVYLAAVLEYTSLPLQVPILLEQGWSSVPRPVFSASVLNVLELAHLILEVLDTSCENLESLAGNAARDNKKQPKQPIVPRYPAAFSLPSRYRPRILATSNTRYLLVYLTAVLEYLQLLLSLYLLVYLTAVLEYLHAVVVYLTAVLEYLFTAVLEYL